MKLELLRKTLEGMGISLGEDQEVRFGRYRDLVLEWNEKVNLTAIKDPEEFERKHFADSVACAGHRGFQEADRIIDVGTGAGFLGIPLAILQPEKDFVLLDSLNKRVRILQEIVSSLELKNVHPIHGRAEDMGRSKDHREVYDLCVSRAVAHLSVLSEYCLPFVRVGGWFAAYKTFDSQEEIKQSQKAVSLLGGAFVEETGAGEEASLNHMIVWIKKKEICKSNYPRKAGIPGKEPLK